MIKINKKKVLTTTLLLGMFVLTGCQNTEPEHVEDDSVTEAVMDDVDGSIQTKEYLKKHPDIEDIYQEKMNLLTSTTAPDFKMTDINGVSYSLSDFEGDDTLVAFVASWCGPCNDMLPVLSEFNKNEENPEVIMVAAFDTEEEYEQFGVVSESMGVNLYMADDFEPEDYMLNSVPQFTYIDKQGEIQIISGGYKELETLIEYAESSFN